MENIIEQSKKWLEADKTELELNNGIKIQDDEYSNTPRWSFDCNFKLDYDGALLKISSRFYPPTLHYGPNWDGVVHVYLVGKEIDQKKFECTDLDELKIQVEAYVKTFVDRVEWLLKSNL